MRPQRRLKVGVLELLAGEVPGGPRARLYHSVWRRQYYSIMPQAVAAWCRRRGHTTHYATYFGQSAPEALLPPDLDLCFIAVLSEAAPLAYALSKILRKRGTRTVVGGPHAYSFPEDASRFFDAVVTDCDEALVAEILAGDHPAGVVFGRGRKPVAIPPLEERHEDVKKASLIAGRYSLFSVVPLLASTGCPYTCDFCVDWDNPYRLRNPDDLRADLDFASRRYPGRLLAFHDPNFGVSFDKTLSVLEEIPPGRRNPYIIESSLSILKAPRLGRLRDTNCIYIAPGVESWSDYGNKAGTGRSTSTEKFERVVAHFELISSFVPGVAANFIFGTDVDSGREPLDLTVAFIDRFPNMFPGLAFPIAYGATPLRERLASEGRLLPLPPMFYFNPLPTLRIKNYGPVEFFGHLADLFGASISPGLTRRRMRAKIPLLARALYLLRTAETAAYVRTLRQFQELLVQDASVRRFNEGQSRAVPEAYHRALDQRLGKYAPLLPRAEREFLVGA